MWEGGPKKKWKSFAEVLADPFNWYVFCSDRPALKKLSNNEVYDNIKKRFDEELSRNKFIENNEKNNFKDKEKVKDYKSLIQPLQDFATNSSH